MRIKTEQLDEIKDAVEEAMSYMLPKFTGTDKLSKLVTSMEADIGHVDFPDGRTAKITIAIEIESGGA